MLARYTVLIIILTVLVLLKTTRYKAGVQVSAMQSTSSSSASRMHRVLAYGDSLTAGTSGMEMYPYAPYLENALKERRKNVVVRHRGLPGWRANEMVGELDAPQTGLLSAIRKVQNPSLSLVIILVGTNDLGWGYSAEQITKNILTLHQAALDCNVPRTIAVGIPPSGYQQMNEAAARLAKAVNTNLETFCRASDSTTFVPFPFEYQRGGDYWHSDTLHFSREGYKVLGERLAPYVEKILDSLEDGDDR